jgi:hypothetical protein
MIAGSASFAGDDLPPQIKVLTQTLRKLNEDDLAGQLEKDLRAKRVTLGSIGDVRAVTGVGALDRSVLLRPLGSGTTDNSMTISDKILVDISTNPRAVNSAANMNNVVGWAMTLRHEYIHMGQRDPHPRPEFENPAYRETVKTGVSWYNRTRAELEDALQAPPTKENLDTIHEIFVRMNAVGQQVNDTFNDMPDRFRDGSLNPDTWTTLEGRRTGDPSEAKRQNWETLGRDQAYFNAKIAKFAAAIPKAADPSGDRIQDTKHFLVQGFWDLNSQGGSSMGLNLLSDRKGELKWQGNAFSFTCTTPPDPKSQTKVTKEVAFKGQLSPDGARMETFDLKIKTTYADGGRVYLVQDEALAMRDLPRTWHPGMRLPFGDKHDEFRFSIDRPEEAKPRLVNFLFKQVLNGRTTEYKAPFKFNRSSNGPPIKIAFGKAPVF